MQKLQTQNFTFLSPSERFIQKSRTELVIVYADKIRKRIGLLLALAFWSCSLIYLASWSLGLFTVEGWNEKGMGIRAIRVLFLGLFIFMGVMAPTLLRLGWNAWTRIEICMDRSNRLVTFHYRHFLRAPTSVRFESRDVAEVVLNRMEWPGTTKNCWWVWLSMRDKDRKLVDGGGFRGPINKLAIDLAEILQVPLRQLDGPVTTHGPFFGDSTASHYHRCSAQENN
jgi:hypothetical protein